MSQPASSNNQSRPLDPSDVGDRYSQRQPDYIGHGTYGTVFSVFDANEPGKVAIKRIELQCENTANLQGNLKSTLREIHILRRLKHENIINLSDLFFPKSLATKDNVYLVLKFMPTDLHNVIHNGGRDQLTSKHIKWLTYSLLCGLKYIHSAKVIHRDLKPRNILLDENCNLKICDFGMARTADTDYLDADAPLTLYVVTRYYRAPEVILNPRQYTNAIDIWSVGCIVAEMLTGRVLFQGSGPIKQTDAILDVLGTPRPEYLTGMSSSGQQYVQSLPRKSKQSWSEVVGKQEASVYDFLDLLLTFVPEQRVSAEAALQHAFLAEIRIDTRRETVYQKERLTLDMEMATLSVQNLKQKITEEVKSFQPAE